MRKFLPLVSALLLLVFLCALSPGQPVELKGDAPPAVAPPSQDVVDAMAVKPEARLGFFQRRRLGLTWANLKPVVKKLREEGKIGNGNPSADAALVMQELMAQDPEAWAVEAPTVDWDAIIEFLERLVPLILKIIELFGLV